MSRVLPDYSPITHATGFTAQYFFNLSHGQPLGWHSGSFNHVKGAQDTVSYPVSGYLIYTPISGWQASPESVAAFEWNGWQASNGMGGRLRAESVAGLDRNTQGRVVPRQDSRSALWVNLRPMDYEFTSPSLAAGAILGGSVSGLTMWKTEKGKTLREIEATDS